MTLTTHSLSTNAFLLCDDSTCKAMGSVPNEQWFNPLYWQEKSAVVDSVFGRGATHFVQHNEQQLVLRHYRRGGLVRHLNEDWFYYSTLKNTRPFMELNLLQLMNELGLPVPVGVAGLVRRSGLGYRADILTLRIKDAKDVHDFLLKQVLAQSVWFDIGGAIKSLHDHQVYHHDLNIKNIMLDAQQKVWIIDFDKCAQKPGDDWKQANLNRLRRSLDKQTALHAHYNFSQQDWECLQDGYRG